MTAGQRSDAELVAPDNAADLCRELSGAELRATRDLPAPRSFSLLVATTLAELPPSAQHLPRAASVLGAESSIATAARGAGIVEPATAADQLVASGLLRLSHR